MGRTKKDLSGISVKPVLNSIAQATQAVSEDKPVKEEIHKLCLSLTVSNRDYVVKLSKAMGITQADFINTLIQSYRDSHPELEEQATRFMQTMSADFRAVLPGSDKKR